MGESRCGRGVTGNIFRMARSMLQSSKLRTRAKAWRSTAVSNANESRHRLWHSIAASDSMSAAAKILLIEDDPGICDTMERLLVEEGHGVAVEKRGDDGLARAAKDLFNVVITDLRLPGLNGLDLVRQLHLAQPRLPIILVTAFGTTETAIEATKSGAYDYLVKPFNMPDLL